MAADAARRQAAYEDVLRAPEQVVAEVLNGDLYTSPRPAGPHAEAASVLGMDLGGAFHRGRGGPGGWIILDEPELHLGRDILVPDLAGWQRSRLPAVPPTAFLELAPDWACEVVSPGSERVDRERKLPIYARERGSHVWLVNPLERMVESIASTATGIASWLLAAERIACASNRLPPSRSSSKRSGRRHRPTPSSSAFAALHEKLVHGDDARAEA
jgi:Uma2 family endonuclease